MKLQNLSPFVKMAENHGGVLMHPMSRFFAYSLKQVFSARLFIYQLKFYYITTIILISFSGQTSARKSRPTSNLHKNLSYL